jgi:hypothetical protein
VVSSHRAQELDDYPFDLNQDEQKELRRNPEGM